MAKYEIKRTEKNLFVPLRGLKHLAGLLLSLDSSPNGTKITVKVQLCTNFVNRNDDKITVLFIQAQ